MTNTRPTDDIAAFLSSLATDCFQVWRFNDAPEPLCDFADQGGDEDWVAVCPPAPPGQDWIDLPEWATLPGPFGSSTDELFKTDRDGRQWAILVGTHS
jgi:hypothetical protein